MARPGAGSLAGHEGPVSRPAAGIPCCVCVVCGYDQVMSKTLSYAVSGPDRERLATAFAHSGTSGPFRVHTEEGVVELPAAAAEAVRHLLVELSSGAAVHVLADDAELTTQEAADLLGISRTYLVRLVDEGKVRAHLVGTHRRLRAADVLAYQARRDARLKAVAEITESDVAADIAYR